MHLFSAPIRRTSLAFGAVLLGATAFGSLIHPTRTATAQTALPALPAGWPATLQLGMGDGPGGAPTMRATAPFGFRYQYLAGGVDPAAPRGWSTWNPNGSFVTDYAQDSAQYGMTPIFTYYMLRQSVPGNSNGNDGDADYTNLQNTATMAAYYDDLKLFFQKAAAATPGRMVVLHVEPDLWGFLQQRASSDNAATVPVQVSSTGLSDLSGLPNNLSGFARAIVLLRDRYGPNVALGYHVSVWGTGNDILYSDPSDQTVMALGTRAGNYYRSLQASFDIAFAEFSDRDAAFKQYQYGDGGAWWSAADYSRNELFISKFVSVAQKRVVYWQIPVGNTKMLAMNNTWDHYQDTHVETLLDDPSEATLQAYLQAGVVAFLFGRGADGATCFCDAAGDQTTNPPAINGNVRPSYNSDDDGGYFRNRATAYYAGGERSLPGGGMPPTPTTAPATSTTVPATATKTPTLLAATSTRTPTPTAGMQTITFDDLTNPNRVLTGQYPSGLVNWGTNAWYLSAPWRQFNTNSIGFNGPTLASSSFTFLSPGRLVQISAYNGGSGPSTVTLSCSGQPTVQTTLAANQLTTIQTGWTATCSSVTVGSTNGWNTNLDSLVVASGGSAPSSTPTRTRTPTATRTATPAPSATPGGAQTLVTFDDLSNPNRALNGQYPSGVINWGTNAWYLSAPWRQFATNSIGFNGPAPTSASFSFVGQRRLTQLAAYNGGAESSVVNVSCAGLPTVAASLAPNQLLTINTGWTGTCTTVTISSTNGWDTNFDSLVVQ